MWSWEMKSPLYLKSIYNETEYTLALFIRHDYVNEKKKKIDLITSIYINSLIFIF